MSWRFQTYPPAVKALLCLSALFVSPIAGAQEGDVRVMAELGYLSATRRPDTLFNPGGILIDSEARTATAAANVKAHIAHGSLRAVLDSWIERREYRQERGVNNADTRLIVPEGYLEFALSDATSLAAGARIARWGTGYAWNPANPLVDPDANNTSRAQPFRRNGDAFIRAETTFGKDSAGIYLTRFLQNDPLLSPLREREEAVVARYQHVGDRADITAFLSFARNERFAGLAASTTVSDQLELHGELGVRTKRRAPQVRSADIPGAHGQTRRLFFWDVEPRDALVAAALIGGQYTLENKANIIVEYLYNGNGLSRSEYQQMRDAAESSAGLLSLPGPDAPSRGFLLDANRLVGRLRRHYLFFRVARDEIFRDTDLHYYLRAGLQDRSVVQGVFMRYSITQRARVQVSGEIYQGPREAETRLIPSKYRIETTFSFDF